MPSYLAYDSVNRILYCTDETNYGSTACLSAFNGAADGKLTAGARINAPIGGIANTLYGGSDGNGFLVMAH